MTYAQHISELTSLVESAILNYDYMVLTEAADDETAMQKVKAAGNSIWNTIVIAIKKLAAFIMNVYNKTIAFIKKTGGHIELARDAEVPVVFNKLPKEHISAIKSAIVDGSFEAPVAVDNIGKMLKKTETIKAGTKLNINDQGKFIDFCNKVLTDLNKKIDTLKNDESNSDKMSAANRLLKVINDITTEINKGLTVVTSNQTEPKKREVVDGKIKVVEESADDFSNRELAAHCLIEAAQLLRESSDLPQDDIDEIPEEKPEVAPEYPETTSGGDELPEDHLEDTKELVNDDKEAMDILTKDEDSKIITEAINLIFDL